MLPLRLRRWSATLLLLLSPAVGGQLLPLMHPCPVSQGPDAAMAETMPAHGMHGGTHSAPAHQHDTEQCSCIGACHAPLLAAVANQADHPASLDASPRHTSWPVIERRIASLRPLDRLPPPTAPPLG